MQDGWGKSLVKAFTTINAKSKCMVCHLYFGAFLEAYLVFHVLVLHLGIEEYCTCEA